MVVGSDNKIKAGVIVQAINSQSEAYITADKITLDGTTQLNGILSVQGGAMVVSTPAVFNNSVQIFGSNTLSTSNLQIVGGAQGEYYTLNADKVKDFITELQIASSNNVYFLQKKTVYNSSEWTDVASFSRGFTPVLSGAWSGATYTVTATGSTPPSTPVSTTVGITGNGQQDSFTVSAFHDGVTTNTVNSINGFLVVTSSSIKINNKAEVRLNAKTGTSSILVSSVSLGDIFDNGAAAVTLSEAWSGAVYKVTASNAKYTTTTIGVAASGNGSDNFTVSAYHDIMTNTVKSTHVYLVENTASKRVEAHWSTSTGTTVGQVSTTATYNAGKADVTLTGAWSNNTYTAETSNGKTASTTVGMTGNGQGDSFTVSAYYGSSTTNTVKSINGFLVLTSSSTRANNKVEARLNASSGTTSILVGSVALGDVFDKGANAVTLGEAWSNNIYTVTASNTKYKSTTIGVTASGNGAANFTISAYHDAVANTVKSDYVYLVENTASKRVEAHLGTSAGTTVGQVSTAATYNAGKSDVTLSGAWSNNTYTATASNGKTATSTVGMTGNGQGTSFTVSAYYGSATTNTVKSINGYLVLTSSSTRANNKVEARLNAASGTTSILVGSVSLGDVFDKGAAGVTLDGAWGENTDNANSATRTATASNGKTNSTTIHLTTSRAVPGEDPVDHFPVWVYYGSNSANCLIKRDIWLTENVSSKRVNARWNTSDGTAYARLDTSATYNAGASGVTLSRTISGNHIQVDASNGKQSNTYVNLSPSGDGSSNFTVSAYYGTDTTNTLISRYVYLVENTSSKRVEARWNSASGTVYGQVSTTATYNAGASAVTLSDAWSNAKYTVTASNNKTKSVTIGLTGNGQTDSFTVSAYYGSNTSNTVKSINGYLVLTSSSTRANNKLECRLNAKTGSSSILVGSVSLVDVYDKGYTAGQGAATHSISCSDVSAQSGSASISGRTNAKSGGISRPAANSYVFFTVKCGGTTKKYYIPVNT